MTPDGKFLYMTERTGSPLGALAVDDATGKLSDLSMVRQFGDALHSDTALMPGQKSVKCIACCANSKKILFMALLGSAVLAPTGCVNMNATTSASSKAASALTRERIAEIIASPDRTAADRSNDVRRKPDQMLAFIGVRPGMVALDLSAGGGYTTELLARAVGPTGRVYGQSAPRNPESVPRPPAAPEGNAAPTVAPAPVASTASPTPAVRRTSAVKAGVW